ncbi:probable receptor-like serine/threonine-protein kinase At5g57670 [Corylus avellana]|uniref:probable receptor-like serine/threonine-protein kinase At5g57670 n=1 Tax=Corylus avellana TaxID=13451 RepID=UPI00286CDD97|nr:probable receptor-like serine/threonine-protein kinase At5g57670 [Corylus avellana]
MIPSSPSKILIGLSFNPEDSKEALSWAITAIARPNDTIVALHILVGKDKKKNLAKKKQSKFRQAKAYVISVLGEFAQTCQSKQVNLEARVGFGSSVGKGLIEEVKSTSADFLLLRGSRNRKNRTSRDITRYCFEHVPESCTFVSIGKSGRAEVYSESNCPHSEETCQSSSRWSNRAASPVPKPSPRTTIDDEEVGGESQSTEDDSCSSGDTSIPESPPLASKTRKQPSPCRQLIASLFGSPMKRKGSSSHEGRQQPLLKCFSYEKISNATNNFHPDNIIGRGGYSEVYRGDLSGGRSIAVKRLARDNKDANKEKEFLMELGIIGHVSHPNTAKLVGCCFENGLYLIFNLSQNGNLASALHGKTCRWLEWPIRYRIAIGVARGLHYLHKCCKHRIIHRDIKASNVLLGPDYEPQITDFGLAKWLPNKWSHHAVLPIEGTFGYLAPEYFMHGIVDEKTDVFAFGVLLLEIITGRRPVDSSKQNLLLWAKPLMESGKLGQLADPKLQGKYDSEQLHTLVLTASYCVRQSSVWRPSMTEVLELLTSGQDTEVAESWRIPKFTSDELDDYSMVFGYDVPTNISLEDYL